MPLSFQQNINFRPIKEDRIDEFEFVGGLVTDVHETKLEPNTSPNLANVLFNNTGSIKTRKGYIRYNTNPVGAASAETNFGASTGTLSLTADTDRIAQTFAEASNAINVLQIDLSLAMATSGQTQRLRVSLFATAAGEPTTILTEDAKSQVITVSGTSETTYSLRFLKPTAGAQSTTYAIVISPFVSGSSPAVNTVYVHHTGNAYAGGQVLTSSSSGVTWAADSTKDIKFTVYNGGNTPITGLVRYYGPGGISQTLAKIGTSMYRGNDNTGAMTAISLGSGVSLNTSSYIDSVITAENTLLVVDGSNYIQKYRGSTNTNYTTGTISVTNGSATVTGSGTSWATTTNAEANEYIKLPDGKWYKIIAVGSNTSLTIEVSYQGSTLAGQTYTISPWGEVQGRLDSTAPGSLTRPQPSYIVNHKDRIWVLDGNNMKSSVLDLSVSGENFNDFDTANNAVEINIPTGKGDTGTGLYSLNNALFVFQRKAIWALYGSSPGDFELRNITNEVGLVDRKTLVEFDNYIVFLSADGDVYMFDGSNLKNISDGLVKENIRTWANKTNAVATLWDNKYLIAYTPSGQTYNTEALYFDLTRQRWGKMTNLYAGVFSNWGGGNDTNQVYFGSSNQGSLYLWNSGTNDDGYEIPFLYDMPSLGFGSGINDKNIKKFYIQQLVQGDYNLTVAQLSDITADETSVDISLSGGTTSLWDVAQWDVDSWSDEGTIITNRLPEFQGLAKYFKYRFENNGLDEPVEILGVTVTARTRKLR